MYVNYEMGRLGTEVIVAYFRVLQNYSFGGEWGKRNICQNTQPIDHRNTKQNI